MSVVARIVAGSRPRRGALLVAGLLAATSLQGQAGSAAPRLRHDTLPNGLAVIVMENHANQLATAHIVFRGGAMTQTPELQGVPHLFEHMLFKSYKGTDGATFAADASLSKAAHNGATGDEEVSYTLWLPSDKLGACMQLLAALVRDPVFTSDNLQTERFVVRNEMQRAASEPEFLMRTAIDRALWGDWFPRKNTIGDDLSLFGANPVTLKALYQQWYVPNNAALVITGDVEVEKALGEARRHFGRWKRQPDPLAVSPIPPLPALDSVQAIVYAHEVQSVTVQLSWRGPDLRTDRDATRDAAAMVDVLNADDSQLQRLLIDSGHFQSAAFDFTTYRNSGEITFRGVTTPDRLLTALSLLGAETARFADATYFDSTSLAVATRRRHVDAVLAREESAAFASAIGSAWASRGTEALLAGTDALAARTPESISGFAARYVVGKPYVIGVLTPAGTEATVRNIVAQFVTYMKDQ